jgi:hypothetical protein
MSAVLLTGAAIIGAASLLTSAAILAWTITSAMRAPIDAHPLVVSAREAVDAEDAAIARARLILSA